MDIKSAKDKWFKIRELIQTKFNKAPDISAILFIIGMRELGVAHTNFTKEQKVKLMHIAVCRVLSYSGHYKLIKTDKLGWPEWELVEKLPYQDLFEQETYLRHHIIHYFEDEELI
ncbi:MAG: hypothetical protein JXR19_05640 [Bacteroidia bacterium]